MEAERQTKDSDSLDRCIQTALAALYPPFQATSPTVLCQVLNVVESCYRGDGLRYLVHFLLPAKTLLQNLQQDACVQYCDLVFHHEGWPLCVHEKVIVQLCPLDQCLLCPGDFYLLVSPAAAPRAHSASCRSNVSFVPRLLLCSVSAGDRHVEQQEVSEVALRSLFSMAWLDSVNREREQRGASRLERCLLSAHGDVFRVPWEDLVYPQFISRPRTVPKEDEESSVKDGHAQIDTPHEDRMNTNSSQDKKLLPPSEKINQSPASSEGEESEGEYVELTELPLPRFSPQKGSLTQSISLQHRARTSTHTHTAAHTLSAHTHSSGVEGSSPTGLCSRLIEENFKQDCGGPVVLTPVSSSSSSSSSSSAPPEVVGTSRTEGTKSGRSLNLHSEQIKEEEGEGDGAEEEEEQEERREDRDLTKTRHEAVVLVGEGEEEEKQEVQEEQQQLDGSKCRWDEEEDESEEGEEGLDEDGEEVAQEVEVEEEVQVIVMQQSPERKEEEQVRRGGGEIEEEQRRCGEEHVDEHSYSEKKTHREDFYSENNTHKDFYSENKIHKNSYAEKKTNENCYSENKRHTMDFYYESTLETHPKYSYSEKNTQEDSYYENKTHQTQPKESYCENKRQTQPEGSYCENTIQKHSEDSYCENTIQTHPEDSYCENTIQTHPEDSYCENTIQTHPEDSYCENTIQTHPEDSYCEKNLQKHPEDSYCENTIQTHSEDSYCENTIQTHPEDSYCENTIQTHPEDSYCENTIQTHPEDSYCEKNLQTHPEDSYCENTIQTHSEDSYCENTIQTHSEDFYCENTIQMHYEDSYCENTIQTHSEDSYCENTIQTHPEDSYCEMRTPLRHLQESRPPRSVSSLWSDPEESEGGREEKEEDEEEEEEVGGGGAAERQTEGPTEPEPPAAVPAVPVQLSRSSQSRFYRLLLRSGAVCLPGTRDRSGRALLTVCTSGTVWSDLDCDSAALHRLMLYYASTLRKEVRALGLTVLVDARRDSPALPLCSALRWLQEDSPGSVHTVLILVNKDSGSLRVDKPAATQVEVLSSLKSVQKHVELQQLPAEYGGSFIFSQSSWISFRSRVEQLTNQCEDVIQLLQKTIDTLQTTPLPDAAQDAQLLLSRYKALMGSVLEDRRLVQLQQEGGASLSRLRREEGGMTEEQRAAVEAVASLYEQVDELLHRLVTLSNSRTQNLDFIVDFSSLETGFIQVSSWLEEVGEVRLKTLDEPEDSLELLNRKQTDFKEFYTTAYDQCKRGEALLARLQSWDNVSSADLHVYEVKVQTFWAQLQDFSQRVDSTGQNIERAVRLFRFLDQAYGWSLEGMRHLAGVSMEECTLPDKCQAVIGCLEEYQQQCPPIPDTRFQEMKVEAGELRGERGLRQWSFAWSKCQETKRMFDRKMEAALRTRDSAHRRRSNSVISRSSASSWKTLSGLWGVRETSSCPPDEDTSSPSPFTSTPAPSPPTPQRTPLLQRLFRSSSSSEESSARVEICSSSPSLPRLDSSLSFTPPSASSSSFFSSRRQQLRKTHSFDCPPTPEVSRCGPCPRALSEPARHGNTGVFIRGLEVSSAEAANHTLCPRTAAHGWAGQGPRSPATPGSSRTPGSPAADPRPRGSKLRHIVEEMVTTEREYVRSLRYTLHHYSPEMDRADLPQDLRGKRSVVFGNLEKLLDFHSQFFLRELEACWKHPLRVPHCFLRHQDQFGLYALYSKNKPKSDALLAHHGHSFFRRKQLELGDKMDLSSYLLKPVQRMSKYALLLTDLMKEVGVAQEAELVALQAATNMVKFQLRHGNDLLAMDAIRDCDVNLKEQGQLIRQDEFTVWTGRRKCQRHIFLFEELVLFSKPKKMEGGLDVFIYKHSFKTADVGLTESTGDSGLRFEIWFRRRTSKNQTFVLQAATADVKLAWTSEVAGILWTQASRNKETRLKEMVSMGVGNKPFLDIQPSDAAISDRAVHYIMKSRGARTRASIAVSVFDHSNPFKRGAVTSDPAASGPSSSSLLGPLNLHMYSQNRPSSPDADASFSAACIEEDEQETSSQPSMTTESSGSSSRCLSGSTGSDSGCVSSHLQEALPEEAGPLNQPSSSSSSSSSKRRLNSRFNSAKAASVIGPATIV